MFTCSIKGSNSLCRFISPNCFTMDTYTTKFGKTGIVVEGFTFRLDKKTKSTSLWRCTVPGCKARCTTDTTITALISASGEHSHPCSSESIEKKNIRASCKRKAIEHPNARPTKLVCTELENSSLDFSEVKLLRDAVYRERLKHRPKLPKNREDVFEILEKYKQDSNEPASETILVNDPDTKIIMLGTSDTIAFLATSEHIYGDGTFKVCPKFFYQVYTFHGFRNGIYVPCVTFILPDKTNETYVHMLGHLQDACSTRDISILFTTMHLDLEQAMHSAVRQFWPHVIIKACQFHVRQAWYRKIQSLGLTTEYTNCDSPVGQ